MIGLSDVVKEKVNQSKYDRIVGCGKRKLISQNMIGLSDVVKEKVNQSKYDRIVGCGERES